MLIRMSKLSFDALSEQGLLERCMAELTSMHRRAFRGRRFRCTVVYRADVTVETLTLCYEPRRVRALRVDEVLTEAVAVEVFYLPVSR
jgi:hypothetical protein